MKLIDKSALVAEIERRIKNLYPKGGQGMVVTKILKDHYEDLLSFIDTLEVNEVDLEKEWKEFLKDGDVGFKEIAKHFFELGKKHAEEKIMANTADATIGLPYENKYGGYTHLIDVSRPLPVGNNKIAIIFKED